LARPLGLRPDVTAADLEGGGIVLAVAGSELAFARGQRSEAIARLEER
jgi:hypothetical protein